MKITKYSNEWTQTMWKNYLSNEHATIYQMGTTGNIFTFLGRQKQGHLPNYF